MPFIVRSNTAIHGAMTFTGNTLGLSQKENENAIGTLHSIGTFITLDTTSKVDNYPNGTTLDYHANCSSAYLNLPAGATVYYAELVWSGTYQTPTVRNFKGMSIPLNDLNNPVTFITPDGISHSIKPSEDTAFTTTSDADVSFYVRSADVTQYVKQYSTGGNRYTAGNIPAVADPLVIRSGTTCYCGWTLAVIYELASYPLRNMVLHVGQDIVNAENRDGVVLTVDKFVTPLKGTIHGHILLCTGEGDSQLTGDTAYFAPNTSQFDNNHRLSGPNNPIGNFFCSQINNDDGLLDTTGTFGTRNNTVTTNPVTLFEGARQGWDITNVDASKQLINGQTTAYLKLTTSGDTYLPNTIGTQIDIQELDLTITKSSDHTDEFVTKDDVIHYTLTIENNDLLLDGTNLQILDFLPTGLTLVPNSVSINGFPKQNIDITSQPGAQIALLEAGDTATVEFDARVTSAPETQNNAYNNQANVMYSYTPVAGITFTDHKSSNIVTCTWYEDSAVLEKTVTPTGNAAPGSELTYTIKFTNNSTPVVRSLTLKDTIPTGTTLINDSCGLIAGAVFTNINPKQSETCTITVRVNNNATGILTNSTTADYTYADGTEGTRTASVSNMVVAPAIKIQKSQSQDYADANDYVTYTLLLSNPSPLPITNIQIKDALPDGLTFVPETFQINSTTIPGITSVTDWIPLTGYSLSNQRSTISVSFVAQVNDTSKAPFVNSAQVQGEYIPEYGTPTTVSNTSNRVTLRHVVPPVTVTKTANRSVIDADGNDQVIYTLTIKSIGDAKNFVLTEPFPSIDNVSMSLDNTVVPNPSITPAGSGTITPTTTGFTVSIPNMTQNTYTVTFTAKAPAIPTGVDIRTFENQASYNYQYAKNPQKPYELTTVNGITQPPVFVTQAAHTYTYDKSIYLASNLNTPITAAYAGETVAFRLLFTNDDQNILNINQLEDVGLPVSQLTLNRTSIVVKANGTPIPSNLYTILYPDENNNILRITFNPAYVLPESATMELDFNATILTTTYTPASDYGTLQYYTGTTPNVTLTTPVRTIYISNPSVTINKYASKNLVQKNEQYFYELIVKNTGNVPLTSVTVSDMNISRYIATGYLKLNGTILVDGNDGGTNPSLVPLPNLAPSQTSVVRIPVEVLAIPDVNSFINMATVTGTAVIDRVDNPRKTVTASAFYTLPCIRIQVNLDKTVNSLIAENNQTITYTITVRNLSTITLEHAYVQDVLPDSIIVDEDSITPPGNLELGIDVGPLAPREVKTITFNAVISLDDTEVPIDPETITNCAYVNFSYTDEDNVVRCGKSSTVCANTTVYTPRISMVKAPETFSTLIGEPFNYTITIENSGNLAFSSLALSDLLPDGLKLDGTTISVTKDGTTTSITADLTSDAYIDLQQTLSPNETVTVTIPVKAVSLPENSETTSCFENTASIRYQYTVNQMLMTDMESTNTVSTCIVVPSVNAVKQGAPTTVSENGLIGYIVNLSNTGNVDLTNVQFTDPLPDGLEYTQTYTIVNGSIYPATPTQGITIPLIKAGTTATIIYTARAVDITKQPYINQGTFSYDYLLNDVTMSVTDQKTNKITITVPDAATGSMSIVKSSLDETIRANDSVTYTLLVSNTGNTTLKDITITDTIPSGLTFVPGSVTLNGQPTSFDITSTDGVTIPILYTEASNMADTAVITFRAQAGNTLVSTYTNTADGTFTAVTTNGNIPGTASSNELTLNGASLTVIKTADRDTAAPGDVINYTVTVTNNSAAAISGVVINDTVDNRAATITNVQLNGNPVSGFPSINVGTLAAAGSAGSSAILTFTAAVDSDASGSALLNSATASGTTSDQKTVQDSDLVGVNLGTSPTPVTPNPQLTIIKSANSSSIGVCGTVIYTLTVSNTGNVDLTNVIVTDNLPTGLVVVPNTTTINENMTGGDITRGLSLGTINTGAASTTISFLVRTQTFALSYSNQASAAFNYVVDSATRSGTSTSNIVTLPFTWSYQMDVEPIRIRMPHELHTASVYSVSMSTENVRSSFVNGNTILQYNYTIYVQYLDRNGQNGFFRFNGQNRLFVGGDATNMCIASFVNYRYDPKCRRLTVFPKLIIG